METNGRRQGPKFANGLLYKKRKNIRVKVDGLVCDIADGNFIFRGVIEDISTDGFKMSNLPKNLTGDSHSYRAIISGNCCHYKLVVVPCWSAEPAKGRSAIVGFKIIHASWEWTEFVLFALKNVI